MATSPDGLSLHDFGIQIELLGIFGVLVGLLGCSIAYVGAAAWAPMLERAAIALKDIIGQ